MLSDLIACLILHYLFFILENHTEIAIDASQSTEEPLDDWEPESEGELHYRAPLLLPHQPSRPDRQHLRLLSINLLLLIA